MKKFFVSAFVMCAMTMTSVSFAQETAKNECPTIEGKECAAPKCDMAKYELFKSTLLDAIRDVIPQNIFDKFSQYL